MIATPALAQNWGALAIVSDTMGVNSNRVCVGDGTRGDIGCPTYAPTVSTGGLVNASSVITGGLSVTGGTSLTTVSATVGGFNSLTAGSAGFGPIAATSVSATNISATNLTVNGQPITSGGGAMDRISTSNVASGASLAAVVASAGTVSFTLGGTAGAAYLHPTLGYVGPGVSVTANATRLLHVSASNISASAISGNGSGLTNLSAASLTGNLPAISGANLTSLNASNLTGNLPAISGANLTNLNASNLSAGTVAAARLGTGMADNTTFLRGDNTWATPANTGSFTGGYFVFTNASVVGGSLGGLNGANSQCLTQLTNSRWWGGRADAQQRGLLTGSKVRAWLCASSGGCQNMLPNTNYRVAGSGGSLGITDYSFTTDSNGLPPNDGILWDSIFSRTLWTYWTGRDNAGNLNSANNCSSWSNTSSLASIGFPGNMNTQRFAQTLHSCNDSLTLVCFVDP